MYQSLLNIPNPLSQYQKQPGVRNIRHFLPTARKYIVQAIHVEKKEPHEI